MKIKNIIAIATVMALLAVMASPITTTVSAADVIVLDGPPTTVEIGHYYSMNLLDYLPDTLSPGTERRTCCPDASCGHGHQVTHCAGCGAECGTRPYCPAGGEQ